MKNSNHNLWTEPMQQRMIALINQFKIEKKNNRNGEPVLSLTNDSKNRIGIIAEMMNGEFNTTLTWSSVANRYHFYSSTPEQREAIRERRRKSEAKRKQNRNQESTSEPTEYTSNIRIADVIIKCGRLVKEDKMPPEELCNLIDTL